LVVDSWSVETNIAAHPIATGSSLQFYLRDGSRLDDWIVHASDAVLTLAEIIIHYQSGQPWVKNSDIDYLLDLIIKTKSGGDVVIDGDVVIADGLSFGSEEAIGSGWHKIANPPTGWKASKTSWATADNFDQGLEVTFSEVPAGAKAVRCVYHKGATAGYIYWRKSGDTNISNTPHASNEYSHAPFTLELYRGIAVFWLSSDYKVQFTVANSGTDLYIAYPTEYLI